MSCLGVRDVGDVIAPTMERLPEASPDATAAGPCELEPRATTAMPALPATTRTAAATAHQPGDGRRDRVATSSAATKSGTGGVRSASARSRVSRSVIAVVLSEFLAQAGAAVGERRLDGAGAAAHHLGDVGDRQAGVV